LNLNNNMITGGQTGCGSDVPAYPAQDVQYGIPNSDLHIYVASASNNTTDSWVAHGAACTLDSYYRPNIGKLVINLNDTL
jgi:hypothetical protein